MDNMKNKLCTKCMLIKSPDKFYKHKISKDGLRNHCKDCYCKININNYFKNTKQCKLNQKRWRKKNPRGIYLNNYIKRRRKNDIGFRILLQCRGRQNLSLKGYTKSGHTFELNGCSNEFFKNYLINRFYNDYPGLTLDLKECDQHHIIPCHTFDMSSPEQQRKCFNYSNVKLMPRECHRELHKLEGYKKAS